MLTLPKGATAPSLMQQLDIVVADLGRANMVNAVERARHVVNVMARVLHDQEERIARLERAALGHVKSLHEIAGKPL